MGAGVVKNGEQVKLPKVFAGILILSFLISISACDKKELSYFPVSTGIEWRYRVELKSSGTSEQSRYYVRSQGEELFEGDKYHVHRSLTGAKTLFSLSDSKIERIGYIVKQGQSSILLEDRILLFPNPADEGSEWDSSIKTRLLIRKGAPGESNILANVPAENVIETVKETVVVPAGKFKNCMKITTNGFAFHSGTQHKSRTLVEIKESRWYAKGIGLVKSTRLETSTSDAFGTREEVLELESFKQP